ncbi:MAG: hypothetical protein RJA36_827 [Pseudomonadota bacterium]
MPSHFPRRSPARALILSLALSVSGGLALAAGQAEPLIAWSEAQAKAAGVVTRVVQAEAGSPAQGLALQGTVQWPAQAIELISTPVAGVVQKVAVGVGQRLRPGQEAATLFSPELLGWQRELLQAESQAGLAARRLERDEKLHAEGLIAGMRLDESRAHNESAQLAVRERRLALKMAGATATLQPALTLRSAAAGTVLEVLATPGQRLDAGMPVARIARHGRLAIALQATPEQARQLREGDALAVAGCRTPARLAAIVPQLLAGNQSVQLVAEFAGTEDCLRANQFVTATLRARPAAQGPAAAPGPQGVALPSEALLYHEGKPFVFLRTPRGFVPTPVELAPRAGAGATAVGGIRPGDAVVVHGIAALKGAWQGLGAGEQ